MSDNEIADSSWGRATLWISPVLIEIVESRGRPSSITEVKMRVPSVARVSRFSMFGGPVEIEPLCVSCSTRSGAVSGCLRQSHTIVIVVSNSAVAKPVNTSSRTLQPWRIKSAILLVGTSGDLYARTGGIGGSTTTLRIRSALSDAADLRSTSPFVPSTGDTCTTPSL